MKQADRHFINGAWRASKGDTQFPVVNPATEEEFGSVALGAKSDIDDAVAAAKAAFPGWSQTTRAERCAYIERILQAYEKKSEAIAQALTQEMGAPLRLARQQAAMAMRHMEIALEVLDAFDFETIEGGCKILRDPVGVSGAITPWNAPASQLICKTAPAFAAGCVVIAKPSEHAPFSARLVAEAIAEAGLPDGVFNLVFGNAAAGAALSAHPDVDMISFTGSAAGGGAAAQAAAPTIKRVHQELGGKGANIILDDADIEAAVKTGVAAMMFHSGQTCGAPSRMLAPRRFYKDIVEIAVSAAQALVVGDPLNEGTELGPLANRPQYQRVLAMIAAGEKEGARRAAGGQRPGGLDKGFFIKPVIFTDVEPTMTIAQEEIFGPVLCIIPYEDDDEAVAIANGTPFGLTGYVQSSDAQRAARVAARLRAGYVSINYPPIDFRAPFGGYGRSGNGRQFGVYSLESYLETKAIIRAAPWDA
ncbi:aldehyde dehydrogenase family protein [Hyphococcus luteus]|uniref:Aldehyde dehydrogenase family protein n=1 Tax=Hyphococcus luteus TaxID=2058213 RepID=A0A2S7K567_9PROT|nr:aldehyde dehydrogenase family protein [Marinicaulis flavus]PQA87616.1 aldehyde dehydrogenase family protein [Marinicaulis flavus]